MNPLGAYLLARLGEPTSWLGIAAFFGSMAAGLASAGMPKSGGVVAAIGLGAGGVGSFLAKEKRP